MTATLKVTHTGVLHIENRYEYDVRIKKAIFNSDELSQWNYATDSVVTLPGTKTTRDPGMMVIPVTGTGTVWLWVHEKNSLEHQSLHTFQVLWDSKGAPYPYILGGDYWERKLREKAMSYGND